MTGTGGLLAVHAHPDDETLATGALLATWAAAGLPVTVVTCTRGERGEVIPADSAHLADDRAALADVRMGELGRALAALGVHDHVQLDDVAPGPPGRRFVDSGMVWADVARATGAPDRTPDAFVDVDVEVAAGLLATVLADRRPDVVVGYEPGGGYGHPDHVQAHRVMHRAVETAATDGYRPAVLWSVLPEARLRAGYAAVAGLVEDGLCPPDPTGPTPVCTVPDEAVQVDVDVRPVRPALLTAMRAHRTQIQAVRAVDDVAGIVGVRALSDGVLAPVLDRECYVAAPGTTGGAVAWPVGVRCVAWPT